MRFFIYLVFIYAVVPANQNNTQMVSFKPKQHKIPLSYKEIKLYTIQLLSANKDKLDYVKNIKNQLPKNLKKDTHIYKSGNYIVLRYSLSKKVSDLKKHLNRFKQTGFKDALIIQTTKWHVMSNILDNQNNIILPHTDTPNKTQTIKTKNTLNIYDITNTIAKAENAYRSGDDTLAIVYYEMLLNSGYKNDKIKNNLCYLYGKKGDFKDAKKIIDSENYINPLLYAYASGALKANKDFTKDISQYILLDNSGRLALLSGAYYEQNKDLNKALGYYKLAYTKNSSDFYNTFALARIYDILQNYETAKKYYKKTLKLIDNNKNKELKRTILYRLATLNKE